MHSNLTLFVTGTCKKVCNIRSESMSSGTYIRSNNNVTTDAQHPETCLAFALPSHHPCSYSETESGRNA